VSTVEVESVISSVLEQADSVVYGVDVPGVEGKAGMAAIVEEAGKFDLERFLSRIRAELPAYAIPLFIRLVSTIDITGRYRYGIYRAIRYPQLDSLINTGIAHCPKSMMLQA
jgi:solute carrier family 27 fatty acid transporter 1/4